METARIERRLSAIMVADVVGYSHLIQVDEAATLAAVKALRTEIIDPLVATHNGRVVKSMGDGLLVEFGSVVDAVACSVAVQKELSSEPEPGVSPARLLVLRIGVNLGDVVVDGEDLLGDAVNIAARLEQKCQPGGVLISGTAYDHLQGKLGLPLDFAGEQLVKNMERPVRSYTVRLDGSVADAPGRTWAIPERIRLPIAAAVLLVAAGLGAGAYHFWPQPPHVVATTKPSIAVLPFVNLGSDAVSGRLAEGLTDDIITDLTRYRDFDIIARNSLEAYRTRSTNVRQIGDELGVRYLLEGSIQRAGDRIRVTAQLIDVASGTNVWSDRWDRPAEDIFAVQSEVSEHTASAVAGSDLLLADMQAAARRKLPGDLQAYDLTVLAYNSFLKGTEAGTLEGIEYAERATARDPNFARAYVQKAWLVQELSKYRRNWNEASVEMEQLARIAIRLDPYDANAHILLAWTLGTLGKNAEAMTETNRALELNPSSADILNMAADTMAFLGKPEEGAAMCDRSFRLNPTPPDWYYSDCVTNLFFTGRYQEAVDAVDRGAASTEASPSMLVWKAASLAELGQADKAAKTVKELEGLYSEVSFEWLLNTGWNFERAQEQDRILEASRKAGLRLCATENEIAEFSSPKRLKECEAQTSG
jgi:TolB-like protein/class 3 adenylate cyclase